MILSLAAIFGMIYFLCFIFDAFKDKNQEFIYIEAPQKSKIDQSNIIDLGKLKMQNDKNLWNVLKSKAKTKRRVDFNVGKSHITCNLPYDD